MASNARGIPPKQADGGRFWSCETAGFWEQESGHFGLGPNTSRHWCLSTLGHTPAISGGTWFRDLAISSHWMHCAEYESNDTAGSSMSRF